MSAAPASSASPATPSPHSPSPPLTTQAHAGRVVPDTIAPGIENILLLLDSKISNYTDSIAMLQDQLASADVTHREQTRHLRRCNLLDGLLRSIDRLEERSQANQAILLTEQLEVCVSAYQHELKGHKLLTTTLSNSEVLARAQAGKDTEFRIRSMQRSADATAEYALLLSDLLHDFKLEMQRR